MREPWNHNIHYYDLVLRSVPPRCRLALDVGCGRGLLACRLAARCETVIAIGAAASVSLPGWPSNVRYIRGDVMAHGFPPSSFDFIAAVATLHHLPLRAALQRFRDLLRPGGVLTVVGLYRFSTPVDYATAAVAFPASWSLRCIRSHVEVGAPVRDPNETLREIREACAEILPGAAINRELLFRFSLSWQKAR